MIGGLLGAESTHASQPTLARRYFALGFIFALWAFAASGPFATEAGAADALPFCTPLPELEGELNHCRDNARLSRAANLCLAKLDAAVAAQQLLLSGLMAKLGAASASAQDAQLANMVADLHRAQGALAALVAAADAAEREIAAFGNSLLFPGPYPRGVVSRLGLAGEFAQYPCYARNARAIEEALAAAHTKRAELQRTSGKVEELAGKNAGNEGNLGAASGSPARQPLRGAPRAAGKLPKAIPGGQQGRSGSRVTGVEKDLEAERKSAPKLR